MFPQGLFERIQGLSFEEAGVPVLAVADVHSLAEEWGLSVREVELAALEIKVMPRRYLRSLGTVGWEGQKRLLRSRVTVVGLGGLGGYVSEALARMGVGELVLVDGDVFVDHNLNRQILSSNDVLGRSKAEVAKERIAHINPAVNVIPRSVYASAENLPSILKGCQVVVDALDNLPARLALQDAAQSLGIPMVHGAIAGFVGQVLTIFPGEPGLRGIYGDKPPEKGVEVEQGTPAATPMMVAAWQVQETLKILLHKGEPLRGRMLLMDAELGTAEFIEL